jgi:SAM-dependent methyltransferase
MTERARRLRKLARPVLTYQPRASRELVPNFLASFPPEARLLNIGSGSTDYGARVTNLDLEPGEHVKVVGAAEHLPFDDGAFDGALMLGVLEHVADSHRALSEARRVLRPEGVLLVAAPFIQGYHPAPLDRRRFSREGLQAELELEGFFVEATGIVNGPASGMAWVTAEFLALLLSGHSRTVHRFAIRLTSWIAWPVKWLDVWLVGHEMAENIASGVWARARRDKSDRQTCGRNRFVSSP